MQQAVIEIGLATEADLDHILELQAANQLTNGGWLTANFSRSRIAAMMNDMPLVVARRGSKVVGFLISSTREMNADIPVIQAMLAAYPGTTDAYVYGPICVGEAARGQGVAQALFAELRHRLPGREGILFIRQDNVASIQAHRKMGIRPTGGFIFNDVEHAVFAYQGQE